MNNAPINFIDIFVRPPGDLLYYLAVIALTQTSFFMALGQRLRRRGERPPGRYTIAALGVVVVWAVLLIGALFALLAGQPADAILPPMERAAHVITLMLLGWAFLTADHERWGRTPNLVTLAMLVLVIVGYVYTGIEWSAAYQNADFNSSVYGVTWTFIAALIAIVCVILCIVNYKMVADAPLKGVYFVILIIGAVTTLTQITGGRLEGDYAGAMRLAFLSSLVVLPALIYRSVVMTLEAEIESMSGTSPVVVPPLVPLPLDHTPVPPSERSSAQLMRALGLILEKATPESIPERIVSSALTVLKADIGLLLMINDPHYADISTGMDRVMGRLITGISVNLDEQPTLVNAVERRMQRTLYLDRNAEELRDFYSRMDIDALGPTYFQPMVSDKEVLAVLTVGLPYTGRELSESEAELLKGIAIIGANLLSLSHAARESRLMAENRVIQAMIKGVSPDEIDDQTVVAAWQETQGALEASRDQIMALSEQITHLKLDLDDERSRVALQLSDTEEGMSISQRMVAVTDEQARLREERDKLMTRLQEAETLLAGAGSGDNDAIYRALIESISHEREALVAQRDDLQAQIAELRATGSTLMPTIVSDMIDRISRDKVRLESERNQLSSKLGDIESQLTALGVEEGTAGVTQVITQLYEQRATLQAKYEQTKAERDVLVAERARYQESIQREDEREARLLKLQNDIKNLAADREAALKQRDKLRSEREETRLRQEELKNQANRLLAEAVGFERELSESQEETGGLRQQIMGLANQLISLNSERDSLVAQLHAAATDRDGLLARVEGDRERMAQLGVDGVGSLTRMIEQLSTQRGDVEQALYETKNALAAAQDRINILQVRADAASIPVVGYQADNPELLLGMLQELRTPMTSIVGYVELMLNESAGILGEMQRKFLQRVSANITRLEGMIDDLIRVTFLDAGRLTLVRQDVDVIEVIEDALTSASNQLREKGLILRMKLDDGLPSVRGDKDAITQIIGQLLTNAYLASPPGKELTVIAQYAPAVMNGAASANGDDEHEALYVSIEDQGGGIAPEDAPRVFARKYRAENPLVQGLGDTGVGLAVAKALIEAHGGSLWLDTTPGRGSIFSFTIPFDVVNDSSVE